MMAANGSALLQAAWNLDSRLHLADSPSWNLRADTDAGPTTRSFLPLSATCQGVPGPGSTSRTNTASTSRAALAIADTATLYEQRSSSNDPPVLEYSRQQELKAQIRSSRAFPDAPTSSNRAPSQRSPNSGRDDSIHHHHYWVTQCPVPAVSY